MLRVNCLNDPYKGGLSSYGLLLMIVAFIQCRELNKVRVPQNINLGNILLDFLHHYGEVHHGAAIMCRKPGDNSESNNFYTRAPEINQGFMTTECPCIDDPLNPQNNVGKSSFHFKEIQKIFKVGYQSAFLGCFCDCHFSRQGHFCQEHVVQEASNPCHPVYTPSSGESIPQI